MGPDAPALNGVNLHGSSGLLQRSGKLQVLAKLLHLWEGDMGTKARHLQRALQQLCLACCAHAQAWAYTYINAARSVDVRSSRAAGLLLTWF